MCQYKGLAVRRGYRMFGLGEALDKSPGSKASLDAERPGGK